MAPHEALRRSGVALAVALAAALVFGAALDHPFLQSHDDGPYVVWNPVVRAPPWQAIRGAFTTAPVGAWAPLHLLSHAVDHAVFGGWAGGSVLVNVALHALDAVLLGWLVLRLGGPPLAGAAAALLFAVHPVQVESVAWISQRKTVLSAAFMLAALHLWIAHARAGPGRERAPYAAALVATAAALLSKAVAVVLPVALAVVDVPLGRARRRVGWLAEKLPFLALAGAAAVVTVLTKEEVSAAVSVAGHTRVAAGGGLAWHGGGPLETFLTMATVLPRYLRLVLWPAGLSAVYLPPVHTGLDGEVAASLALLALLAVAGGLLARRAPRLFAWYGLFFLGLLPVSQIVPQVTLMNDRYLYVPMLGAAALAGEGLAAASARLGPGGRRALAAGALLALAALGLAARARVPVWSSDLALWTDATAKAPGSPTAWYNLARSRQAAGLEGGALLAYLRAAELDPQDGDAAVNAGAILLARSELARAAPLVEAGARLVPSSTEALFNLGLLRFAQGSPSEAEPPLRAALAREPGACNAAALLGHALVLTGRPDAALDAYRAASGAGCADPEVALYRAFAESERGDEAAAQRGLAEAIPAAARLGPGLLERPTLRPLRAHPRFELLLRRHASARGAP
jgi:hypothetical protein